MGFSWEAHCILPFLSLLCCVYVVVLVLDDTRPTHASSGSFTPVVVPPDSARAFQDMLRRVRGERAFTEGALDPWDVDAISDPLRGGGDAARDGTGGLFKRDSIGLEPAFDDDFFLPQDDHQALVQLHGEGGGAAPRKVEPSSERTCREGYLTMRSMYNYKFLWTHGEREGWLAATATMDTPLAMKTFKAEPVMGTCEIGSDWVKLRPAERESAGYIRVIPPGNRSADEWTFQVTSSDAREADLDDTYHFGIEEEGYVYSKGVQGMVNVMSEAQYGARGRSSSFNRAAPADREFSAGFNIRWINERDVRRSVEAAAKLRTEEEEQDQQYIKLIRDFPASAENRVVAFGLYGSDPKYVNGAVRNAELAPTYFPGWSLRYYVASDVPEAIVSKLRELGAEVIVRSGRYSRAEGMFWRFSIADDPTVDRFIVRDVDSRLNARDSMAVNEWVESGLLVHTVRDHVNHCIHLNGGLWGARRGAVKGMAEKLAQWNDKDSYGSDLNFLNQVVWPEVSRNTLAHDSYCCLRFMGPNTHAFPTKRPPSFQHVGQVFDGNDVPRYTDIDGFIRNVYAPEQCRKFPDWLYG